MTVDKMSSDKSHIALSMFKDFDTKLFQITIFFNYPANLLWSIREDYYSLLTDLDSLTVGEVMNKRDKLKEKTAKVYATAPQTDARSYKAAQQALKVEEAQCFAAGELNMLLPAHLQHDVVDKENRR